MHYHPHSRLPLRKVGKPTARLVQAMRKQGFVIDRYRVRYMMKAAMLIPVCKRKFVRTTNSRHAGRLAPNWLQQDFNIKAPNRVGVADITYIRTQSGWLYLAAASMRVMSMMSTWHGWQRIKWRQV